MRTKCEAPECIRVRSRRESSVGPQLRGKTPNVLRMSVGRELMVVEKPENPDVRDNGIALRINKNILLFVQPDQRTASTLQGDLFYQAEV